MTLVSKNAFLVIVMVISSIPTSCNILENTDRRVIGEHKFAIEPDAILQSILEGEEGVFSPIRSDDESGELYPQLVTWDQADYLLIADALHEFLWNDSIYDWSVNYLSFSLLCDEVGKGFQSASFSFFQEKPASHKNSEIEHQIDIYPGKHSINAWEFAYDSRLFSGDFVEITEALSADEALMIAESNGGLGERITIKNDCEISAILSPNSRNDFEWKIFYSPEVFSLTIDPITGEPIK